MELVQLMFLLYFAYSVIYDFRTRYDHFMWNISLMIDMSGLLLTIVGLVSSL